MKNTENHQHYVEKIELSSGVCMCILTELPMLASAELARSSLVFLGQEMNQRVM